MFLMITVIFVILFEGVYSTPILSKPIPKQAIAPSTYFEYTIPHDTFTDVNGIPFTTSVVASPFWIESSSFDPVLIGSEYYPEGITFDVFLDGDFLFYADYNGGLKILDVTNSSYPQKVGGISLEFACKVHVQGNYAYVAESYGGVQIIDVSDKTNPIIVSEYRKIMYHPRSVFVENDILYVGVRHIDHPISPAGGVVLVDVSNKSSPVELSFYSDPSYSAVFGIYVEDGYGYLCHLENGVSIIDVSNPYNIYHIGGYNSTGSGEAFDLVVDLDHPTAGDTLFIADTYGVRILNIDDKSTPTFVGFYPTSESVTSLSKYSYDDEDDNLLIFFANGLDGVGIINVTVRETPFSVGSWNPSGSRTIERISVSGDGKYTYCAAMDEGVLILDTDHPTMASPNLISHVRSQLSDPRDMHVSADGNLACICNGVESVEILDLSNPENPQIASSYSEITECKSCYLPGDGYLYIAEESSTTDLLQILDISTPSVPIKVGFFYESGKGTVFKTCSVFGTYAYCTATEGVLSLGFHIIDVSDRSNPLYVSKFDPAPFTAGHVFVDGNTAFADDQNRVLRTVDITTKSSPEALDMYGTFQFGIDRNLFKHGDFVYLTDTDNGIRVISVSDPSDISELSNFHPSGYGSAVDIHCVGEYAVVADGSGGMLFLDISNPASLEVRFLYYEADFLNVESVSMVGNYGFAMGVGEGDGFRVVHINGMKIFGTTPSEEIGDVVVTILATDDTGSVAHNITLFIGYPDHENDDDDEGSDDDDDNNNDDDKDEGNDDNNLGTILAGTIGGSFGLICVIFFSFLVVCLCLFCVITIVICLFLAVVVCCAVLLCGCGGGGGVAIVSSSSSSKKEKVKQKLEQNLEGGPAAPKLEIRNDLFEIQFENIQLLKQIGQGGGGATIYRATWNDLDVAVKIFRANPFDLQRGLEEEEDNVFQEFEREVGIMGSISHPYILRWYGCTLQKSKVGIVMEFCENGDLGRCIGTGLINSKNDCIRICSEISSAMSYLHSRKIIHRDLKPGNILMSGGDTNTTLTAKVMDFGLSRVIEKSFQPDLTKRIGTSYYMSPEITLGKNYGLKTDVFAYGIIMYDILAGTIFPYGKTLNYQIEFKVANDPNHRPEWREDLNEKWEGDEWIVECMRKCWSHEERDRPSFEDINTIFREKV